jgi:tetratricopeptide (TPR) repeat protein
MRRRFLQIVLALALVAPAMAQQKPAPNASPAPSPARRPPQAKTQAEFKDYNAAYAVNTGGAAAEKAANDFAAKYPASELRSILYTKTLHDYQSENNAPKMLEMGEKVLALDPENSVALVLTATILSDSLTDADQDRQQKIEKIKKNANHALATIDAVFMPPANATPEQIAGYKSTLRSIAHSALGITDLKTGNDVEAEKELRQAADLGKAQPDPYVWYHLALSQDHQEKYADALVSVEQAVKFSKPGSDLTKLAAGERERLQKLMQAPGQPPATNSSQPPH